MGLGLKSNFFAGFESETKYFGLIWVSLSLKSNVFQKAKVILERNPFLHFYFLKLSFRCFPKLVQRHKLVIPTNEMKPESENFTISKVSAEICPSVADHPNTFDIIVLQVKNSVTMTTKTRKQLDHPFCGDCFMN